ncbi:hypothetical protein XANCAGTX0491_002815 [Xanthoria calcicola]
MKTSVAPILGLILATTASVLTPRASNCNGAGYKPTVENWKDAKVDRSLRAFWDGGKDAEGVDWPGANQYGNPRQFASMLGTRLQNSAVWSCSKLPSDVKCTVERCTEIGRRNRGGNMVGDPSRWGILALESVLNLHTWFSDIWNGLRDGQQGATSVVFKAAQDFVKPDSKVNADIKSIVAGASFMIGILGGFPGAAIANSAAGALSASLGIALSASSGDQRFQGADAFSTAIESFTQQSRASLLQINNAILNSADDFALDVLRGGAWIVAPTYSAQDIGNFYKRSMIARGINALWRQYNVYVYYTWLDDAGAKSKDAGTKCDLDRSGPQDSKYCADEGVYYLYLYLAGQRSAGYPYGGNKLQAEYNINPKWAVESSARSFKAQGINYDAASADVTKTLGARNLDQFIGFPEILEGTWTLPVCDGSSRGRFNVDYTREKNYDPRGGRGEPPCACGIDGRDTATFIKAANFNSESVANMCLRSWTETKLADWPEGVDRIVYGEGRKSVVTKKDVENCMGKRSTSRPTCDL